MKIEIIYLDMDGVIADFFSGLGRLMGLPLPPGMTSEGYTNPKWLGMHHTEVEPYIEKVGHSFWENLEAFGHTSELVELISYYPRWEILTHPMKAESCRTGKRAWLDRYFGPEIIAHMRGDKHALAHANAVLIDDMPSNIEKFRSAGGQGILFPTYYNANSAHSSDPVGYVRAELQKIEKS